MRVGERGFTFVVVLVLLALTALGMSLAGPLWSEQMRRERERELLRIGTMYAKALRDYYHASPGSDKEYPQQLEQLLMDTRFVGTRRHLRKLYPDPISPKQAWGLMRDEQGGIVGVYSQSFAAPIATRPIDIGVVRLPPGQHYSDWKFMGRTVQPDN
jgi:type II secretory pathway pseudopilin PulG